MADPNTTDEDHPPLSSSIAGFDPVAKLLMAGVATLISAAATFGAVTGGIAVLLRNSSSYMTAALCLAALAAAIAAAVTIWPSRIDRPWAIRATAFLLSGGLLAIALLLVVNTQARLASSGSRPVIHTEWNTSAGIATLAFTASADGLAINDRLFANVLAYPRGQQAFLSYYSGFTGPDVNGHSEQKVAVPVPLTETELIGGTPTPVPIGSVMVAAIVQKEGQTPTIAPGHPVGVTCEGEVFATNNGQKVTESDPPIATTTKPACIYLRALPTAPPATPVGGGSVAVPSATAWTDTRVYVAKGQVLSVRASGRVSFIAGGPLVGPNGASDAHPGVGVLPGADHHAALIGRIVGAENTVGPPFLVGDNFAKVMNDTGLLALGVNDIGVDNNSGHFDVRVELAVA